MTPAAPFLSQPIEVERGWIDYNGHLNMAFYNVIFDRGADEAFALLGLGPDYAEARRLTIYTAETHVCYLRELHLAEEVRVAFQILDHDAKRLHTFQEIVHPEGWTAATCETLSLHIDMSGPKVAPFPDDILARIAAMRDAQAALLRPERAGRSIGIARRA
jgi:acyl-CoA thioester hydrolase